jgi:hypothetical protein
MPLGFGLIAALWRYQRSPGNMRHAADQGHHYRLSNVTGEAAKVGRRAACEWEAVP